MRNETLVTVISIAVALAAVFVAIAQGRSVARLTRSANEIAVVTGLYDEYRSNAFQNDLRAVLELREGDPDEGFLGLHELTDRARYVCYYFEYLGQLVAFGCIEEDLVLGIKSTQLLTVWQVLEPYIYGERERRKRELPAGVSKRFLPHYESLIVRVLQRRGPDGNISIKGRVLHSLDRPVRETIPSPRPADPSPAAS